MSSVSNETIRVALGVATFLRPDMLRRLLASLSSMHVPAQVDLNLIVCDNDPHGSAEDVTRAFRPLFARPVLYGIEGKPGISEARNWIVSKALERNSDFVAFVDDDDWVDQHWLAELLESQRTWNADIVQGLVIPVFESGVTSWRTRCAVYYQKRPADGGALSTAATNNVLFRSSCFSDGFRFDSSLGLTGGSDAEFTFRLTLNGKKCVFSAGSKVHEFVPRSRTTVAWIVKRLFRKGITSGLIYSNSWQRLKCKSRIKALLRAPYFLFKGFSLLGLGAMTLRPEHLVMGIGFLARSVGVILGTLKITSFEEYAR